MGLKTKLHQEQLNLNQSSILKENFTTKSANSPVEIIAM
jgi:hypothetical protein